jgi:hypothetical protein
LLDLFAVLDLVDKDLGWFKTWYKVFIDHQGCVPRNVPRDLTLAFLVDKASKAPDVYIVSIGHRIFYDAKKGLH